MNQKDFLLQEIRCSVYGNAWHGPALLESLDGVTAREAAARRVAHAHTIWEIVLHAIGWMEEAARRLQGGAPALPRRGDWVGVADSSEAAWKVALEEVDRAFAGLEAALSALPEERLDEAGGGMDFNPELGTGVSYRRMLSGVAQHNAYHAGQIVLLRRTYKSAGGEGAHL